MRVRACSVVFTLAVSLTKSLYFSEAALLATGNTKRCISCSTLAECELFENAGFDDILFTRIFTVDRLPRYVETSRRS